MTPCPGCGGTVPPRTAPGPPRVWCSPTCRKRTLYGQDCIGCGKRTNGSDRYPEPYRCRYCEREYTNGERNLRILQLWGAGKTAPQIAADLTIAPRTVMWIVQSTRDKGGPVPLHRWQNRKLWPEVERMWNNEGLSGGEIARILCTTRENINVMVKTMRKVGIDLKYRQPRVAR